MVGLSRSVSSPGKDLLLSPLSCLPAIQAFSHTPLGHSGILRSFANCVQAEINDGVCLAVGVGSGDDYLRAPSASAPYLLCTTQADMGLLEIRFPNVEREAPATTARGFVNLCSIHSVNMHSLRLTRGTFPPGTLMLVEGGH